MSEHRSRRVGAAVVLLVACIASGCSTQARWVNCEGRLEAINRPASKSKDSPSQAPASPNTGRPP